MGGSGQNKQTNPASMVFTKAHLKQKDL
jgi:hypothetical protein